MKKKQLISLIIILLIIVASTSYYFINLGPVSNSNEKVDVTISRGSSITKVASMLKERSLIKNKTVFMLYYKIHNLKLQAGKYSFMPSESAKDIANKLNHGEVSNTVTWLKLIEGHTLKNYADKYSQVLNLTLEEVIKGLEDKTMLSEMINKYWFLTNDISKKGIYFPLEGYLFPDSYQVYYNSQIKDIVKKQLTNLEKKLEPFKSKIESEKLNVHEIITMASLIEKEANTKEDRYMVAGVIKNRIAKKMTLGLDVTTYYAEQVEMGSVKDLTIAQYNASNDYNTRGPLVGYPIGPICNPSLESIEAALFPKETDNLYFFAEKSGKVHFSKTLEEHNIIKNKYKW